MNVYHEEWNGLNPDRATPFVNILCREFSRPLVCRGESTRGRFLTDWLKLKVNQAKSAVARPEERKFLGFSISNDGSERRIAPRALAIFKTRIRR